MTSNRKRHLPEPLILKWLTFLSSYQSSISLQLENGTFCSPHFPSRHFPLAWAFTGLVYVVKTAVSPHMQLLQCVMNTLCRCSNLPFLSLTIFLPLFFIIVPDTWNNRLWYRCFIYGWSFCNLLFSPFCLLWAYVLIAIFRKKIFWWGLKDVLNYNDKTLRCNYICLLEWS